MKPLKRLIGLFLFIIFALLMSIPFFILWILFGIDKANVIMSTVMRVPMNMISDTNDGDKLLSIHKEMYEEFI